MLAVAAMTQAGFAGNLRYVALPAALVCVLAGAGWTDLIRALARRVGPVGAGAAAVALALAALPAVREARDALRADLDVVERESVLSEALAPAVASAGGRAAVLRCRPLYTAHFEQEAVAWALGVHTDEVRILPAPPGTAVAPAASALGRDPRFRPVAPAGPWIVARNCGAATTP